MQFNIASSFSGQTMLVQGFEQAPQPRITNLFSQTVLPGPTLRVDGSAGTNPSAAGLRASEADGILKTARAMWALSGITTAEFQLLQQTTLQVADLAGDGLGRRAGTTIIVDANAADFGWFVDATPGATEEFVRRRTRPGQPFREREFFARENGPAHQRIDLLTVVLHEMGQVIGRNSTNTPIPLMDGALALGVRKLPPGAADAFFAQL